MDIPKKNKMMVAFVSWRNPVLAGATRPSQQTADKLAEFLGISRSTLPNWRMGRTISAEAAETVFSRAVSLVESGLHSNELKPILVEKILAFQKIYERDPEQSLYDSVAILGMSVDDCQNVIDEAIYERLPVFPGLFYDTMSGSRMAVGQAEAALRRYQGLYDLWLKRGETLWLHCLLRVRYILKMRQGVVIRCKLNLPALNHDENENLSYWEYDGYLAARGELHRLYWMFEQRTETNSDYLNFITDTGNQYPQGSGGRFTLDGTYLTTGQDDHRTIWSSDVLIQRRPESDVAAMEVAMRTARFVDEASEIAELDARLKAYRDRH